MNLEELRNELLANADDDYRVFDEKLNPRAAKVLGVRMPVLRKIAKKIIKEDFRELLDDSEFGGRSFEENLVRGIVIATGKMEINERLSYLENFVPRIVDWATCDAVVMSFRMRAEEMEKYWDFILRYQDSKNEFEVRFMLVMMLNHFLDAQYFDQILKIVDGNKNTGYYAEMAAAWLIAEGFVKDYDKTLDFVKSESHLSRFVFKKALTKAVESYRITDEQKEELRGLRGRQENASVASFEFLCRDNKILNKCSVFYYGRGDRT